MNPINHKTATVKELIRERDLLINQLQKQLVILEESLSKVANQSSFEEQREFMNITSLIDDTLNEIETNRAYYKREIIRAAKYIADPLFEKEYCKLLNQICLN